MFEPGDVVWFLSEKANKPKYHLCISQRGHFLFINSPKKKEFMGDFVVSCDDLPCIPAHESGKSVISCVLQVPMSNHHLKKAKAKKLGRVNARVLIRLMNFVENSPVLSQEEKELIIQGLVDWA